MEDTRLILNRLDTIKEELDYIKAHMLDTDAILTQDDLLALQDAEQDFKKGKTKRIA